jgi:NADH dehydrogenase
VTLNNLPGVAEVAMQGSLHAANTIMRRLRGDHEAVPYTYRDLGSVAAIGRFRAICSVGRLRLSGFAGWLVWMFVHLAFLNGMGNRATTMLRWLRWLVGRNRVERVFSVAHTGGDLSAPESVRAEIEPNRFPAMRHDNNPTGGGQQ